MTEIITKSGSWYSFGDMRLGDKAGREKAKDFLRDNPALVEEISRKVLEKKGLLNPPGAPENGQLTDQTPIPAPKVEKAEKAEKPEKPERSRRQAAAPAE